MADNPPSDKLSVRVSPALKKDLKIEALQKGHGSLQKYVDWILERREQLREETD